MMRTKKSLIFAYTVIFAVLCAIVFYPFYRNGRSFVWCAGGQDGIAQHLNALVYWGQYIREFFGNMIHGHFKFPMWDMSIGYGGDILATLNYYAIGDPLNLLYVFSNKHNAEYFYQVLYFVRMYLVGISFIAYGLYMKKDNKGILCGSLIYLFCGFFFKACLRHPFFLNPMIYFPLMLIGVEKIFRKERPYLLMFMATLGAISNFYFFYMLTLFTVIYAAIRYHNYEKIKNFFKVFFKFAGWYLLGIGLSAVILLPVLIGFSGNGRTSSGMNYFTYFYYPMTYYKAAVHQFIGYEAIERATSMNYVALSLLAVVALFVQKKKGRIDLKIALIIGIAGLLLPPIAYVFHGFSYPMNRWIFALSFVMGAIVMEMYQDLLKLSIWQEIGMAVLCVIYIVTSYYIVEERTKELKVILAVLVGSFLILLLMNHIEFFKKGPFHHVAMLGIVCVSIGIAGYFNFSTKESAVIGDYLESGKVWNYLEKDGAKLLTSADNQGFYRSEAYGANQYNWGLSYHTPTTTNYLSVTDGNVSKALRQTETMGYFYTFKFRKLDKRKGFMSLYGVKYVTFPLKEKVSKKDFRLIKKQGNFGLYENKKVLPFGYTYDSYVRESEYEKLNGIDREQTMLSSAIVEDQDKIGVQKNVPQKLSKVEEVGSDYKITKSPKNRVWKIKIPAVAATKKQKVYIRLEGMSSIKEKNKVRRHKLPTGVNANTLSARFHGKSFLLPNEQQGGTYYFGKRTFLLPANGKKGTLKIDLKAPGYYTIDKISVITIDKAEINKAIEQRQKSEHLKNISYDMGNHFSGTITTKGRRILCIPIAYSKGWKAYDHGQKVEVKKVNGMFLGIELKKGKHTIRLDYVTPGLKAGAGITVISLCILVVLAGKRRKITKGNC